MNLDEIWQKIEDAIILDEADPLEEVVEFVCRQENIQNEINADILYAAGYASYMLPKGQAKKELAKELFRKALIVEPGHIGALLYLAYIALDAEDFSTAFGIVFSVPTSSFSEDTEHVELADRIVEARVFILARMGMFAEALIHMEWFERRLDEDSSCGVSMINFMKLLDDDNRFSPIPEPLVKKLKLVLKIEG